MDTVQNKRKLWDQLVETNGFKEGVDIETSKLLFESILLSIHKGDGSLHEKNELFLYEFKKQLQLSEYEERLKKNQDRYKTIPPPLKELAEIKELLYIIMAKLDNIS
jgi:hypothetical protein